jgi:hypothetical protein
MDEGRPAPKYFLWIGLVAAVVAALFMSGAFSSLADGGEGRRTDAAALRSARDRHLVPIRSLLEENGRISSELRDRFVEYPGGIQESYHAKVMRDGEAKHRDMKEMIERLNRNNLSILAHLEAYGEPRTEDLKEQAAFFREHALRYDQRWKALPKAAAAKSELPVAQPMFPPAFPRAVAAELAAADRALRPQAPAER